MPGRDLNGPVTVINRFRVKGDTGKFEREFHEHSQFLRRQRGFDFLVTVRLVEQPQRYVHLGHWRSLRDFLDVVHDDTFLDRVRRLGALVETEADQAVSVGRTLHDDAAVGDADVVLLHARVRGSGDEFERRFRELTHRWARLDGFGGSDLLRSTLSPTTYVGLSWWRDGDACVSALADPRAGDRLRDVSEIADVTTERTVHMAYQRVIG
ncbi:antibiotic biosynthesis monooxygenase [Streptomyces angustmyceticus]|uniref:ABM domain-containing protein n=1 Tax=Streptomyces angustmyceticus TaxID=285578 RepID=A0A5J4L8D4_9ACTN|nr:antibiotic biosynthesis monooxygenase [Streptomyces angustmyceticus]UAL65873.1 antibiotic biosynthesis monooxygenase [Streptomyces angustmyceticus]GES27556.1 hypothetical protein San01_00420 [Streptomyces angustmyceticus]